jgi:hypothetical protein
MATTPQRRRLTEPLESITAFFGVVTVLGGPFTVQVATAIRRLGWVIIVGNLAVGAVQGFALDQLLNTMLTVQDEYGDAITGMLHALFPVPVLVGAALLTFARIFRLGAEMDDDLQGTV